MAATCATSAMILRMSRNHAAARLEDPERSTVGSASARRHFAASPTPCPKLPPLAVTMSPPSRVTYKPDAGWDRGSGSFTGLDPEAIRWIRTLLRGHRGAGGGRFWCPATRWPRSAQTADDVVVIDRRRLVVQSSLADLMGRASRLVRIRTSRIDELRAVLTAAGAQARAGRPAGGTGCPPERVALPAAERSIPIVESAAETATLEDVFFQLGLCIERSQVILVGRSPATHLSGRPKRRRSGPLLPSVGSDTWFFPQDLRSRSRGIAQCNRPGRPASRRLARTHRLATRPAASAPAAPGRGQRGAAAPGWPRPAAPRTGR
jgi:hypothetical protein